MTEILYSRDREIRNLTGGVTQEVSEHLSMLLVESLKSLCTVFRMKLHSDWLHRLVCPSARTRRSWGAVFQEAVEEK